MAVASNISGSLKPFRLRSSSLSEIDLFQNSISGSFFDLSKFSSCSSISSLKISFNLLDSSKDLTVTHFGLSLKTLDVSMNHLYGQQVLPWVFSQGSEKLTRLSLKGNKLQVTFSLDGCSNLEFLDLSSNNNSNSMPNLGKIVQICSILTYQ
ncbi:unnamed protein product [Amaranthus hypochondriacus]